MKFSFTEEMMIDALKANGWGYGWAGDDWVSSTMNADHGGLTLKEAFAALLFSSNLIPNDVSNCWSI